MDGVERYAEGVVQPGAGDLGLLGAADDFLAGGSEMDFDGEDVGIGGHLRVAEGDGAVAGCFDGLYRLFGGRAAGIGEEGAVIGTGGIGENFEFAAAAFFGGHATAGFGFAAAGVGAAEIINGLFDADLRLEVLERVRADQGGDGEIGLAELALGEERAEDVDRVIAALDAFLPLHFGEAGGIDLAATSGGGGLEVTGGGNGGVVLQGPTSGVGEGEIGGG